MGRPKGSKNKVKSDSKPSTENISKRIADLESAIPKTTATIEQIEQDISALTQQLSAKKIELRTAKREAARMEKLHERLTQKAEEESKRMEAEKLVQEFIASGKSIETLQDAIKKLK